MKKILSNSKVYVTSQKRLDEGSLTGKWMYPTAYKTLNDFMDACKALFADEEEPVVVFLDAQGLDSDDFVSEYEIKDIFECNSLSSKDAELLTAWYNMQPKKDYSLKALDEAKAHLVGSFTYHADFGNGTPRQ